MHPSMGGRSRPQGAVSSARQYKLPVSRSRCKVSLSGSVGGGTSLAVWAMTPLCHAHHTRYRGPGRIAHEPGRLDIDGPETATDSGTTHLVQLSGPQAFIKRKVENVQNSRVLRAILIASGLIAIGVGGATLIAPVAFERSYGVELGSNISLLSEVRAPGAALLASGALMISGAFVPKLAFTSTVTATVWFLSCGASRLLSMVLDGIPDSGLVQAAVLEIAIGVLGALALVRFRLATTSAARPQSAGS